MRVNLPKCFALTSLAAMMSLPTAASGQPVSYRDSFPIGNNGLCEAQIQPPAPGASLFDRSYAVICRDASAPVGSLAVNRLSEGSEEEAVAALGNCVATENAEGVPADVRTLLCTDQDSGIRRVALTGTKSGKLFVAEAIASYSDAAELGFLSVFTDRLASGEVEIPLTQASDARAFARAQAQAIDANAALNEAYRRSNQGNFAEAAEFFSQSAITLSGDSAVEARLNEALQHSNLGNYAAAEEQFDAVRQAAEADPVLARLLRNFEAVHYLNTDSAARALDLLEQPLAERPVGTQLRELVIGEALARRLSAEQSSVFAGTQELSALERAELLDGQAAYLRATALRMMDRGDEAVTALRESDATLASVRDGRIVSILWLRGQVLGELAENLERTGDPAGAETLHREAISLLEDNYPGSPALLSARAQLAGLYLRSGRTKEARDTYRDLVDKAEGTPSPSLRALMRPYFALLADDETDPEAAAAELFLASQLLLRPGLAQTQAVLARELSAGDDEAAQLFRQSTNLARSIERVRNSLAQLRGRAEESPEIAARIAGREQELAALQARQLAMQEKLGAYPRYRVISDGRVTLDDMRATLRDGEGYFKLVALGRDLYGIYIDGAMARAYRVDSTVDDLEGQVAQIRASIAVIENGQTVTYPFDIEAARDLYVTLFEPVDGNLRELTHLVFEPDGAMLKLPANLLVMNDESVTRYVERMARRNADPYDFTGTEWLGREMRVTTSVSPASFRDVRNAPRSSAANAYLGLGENEPIGAGTATRGGTRSALAGGERCMWSPAIWGDPIDATELRTAANLLSTMNGQPKVVTGDAFTDTAVRQMEDIDEYRIIHFATHGLVTAPQEGCPPRPALLTSFGEEGSDGLLSFAEIYDLKLDADLVILSACDTAGTATVGATREAGVTSGGDFALDGLVRAFVGAGGRSVLASHWPVPDDFDATQRLVTGLFTSGSGNSTGEALRLSQRQLMDEAQTSHPFYWSAFAIVGDAEIAVAQNAAKQPDAPIAEAP